MVRSNFHILFCSLLLLGCVEHEQPNNSNQSTVLRLAVTTSTRDSGLLDVLIPVFEEANKTRVDLIAVGTGAALELGEAGDVDVVFVHSRQAEEEFMAAGHGVRRENVMYNMFEILGPQADPAGIQGLEAPHALQQIASNDSRFVSRGDKSGTHQREKKLWEAETGRPEWKGYIETGQGMGATLIIADQMSAYVLSDHGTFLKFKEKIQLVSLVTDSVNLRNEYGIMVVNPEKHSQINESLGQKFVEFLISLQAQQLIQDYRIHGEQLFYPLHIPDKE